MSGSAEPRAGRAAAAGALAVALAAVIAAAAAARPAPTAPARGPFVRVLGTAQDGGLPHAACTCVRCERARVDPAFRRLVASLAIIDPTGGEPHVVLVDATPDLPAQLERLADARRPPAGAVDRAPLDGVLLTHAHVGHYLGLAFLGYEVVHVQRLPVWATPRLADYLAANGPWSQLVRMGEIELRPTPPGRAIEVTPAVRVEAIAVPHRDEYADTVGFLITGPRRRLLYVPDTDRWESWEPPLAERLAGVDVALLDGTFFSLGELPGRSVEQIGHPLITTTMDLLAERVAAGGLAVYFTHLNHSNPALEPEGAAAAEIRRRGFAVLADGQEIDL